MTIKLYKKVCLRCGDPEQRDSSEHGQCYGGDLHKWEAVPAPGIIQCESCRDMVAYCDAARREANKRGRVTGEPLNEWISRLPLENDRPATEAYANGYLAAFLVAKQLEPEDFAKWKESEFICLDCGAMTFDPRYGCSHQRSAARPSSPRQSPDKEET